MSWNDYPLVRIAGPFILGIPVWSYFQWSENLILSSLAILLFLQFLTAYFPRFYPAFKFRFVSTGFIYLLFFFLGMLVTMYQFPYKSNTYFGNIAGSYQGAIVEVIDAPVETPKTYKTIVEIKALVQGDSLRQTIGKALLYLKRDSTSNPPPIGAILIVNNKLQEIESPSNPHTFNYKRFMDRKGIRYSAFLKESDYKILQIVPSNSLKMIALNIRQSLLSYLEKNGIKGDEHAIASSLLLGYKAELSDDLQAAYRSAGVMHILCVSGMHVGILFLILSQILGFLSHIKGGNTIRLIIIVLNIWAFAIITGLSPSVTRAAVMFTFVSIGKNINRNINIYNTLASAAILTLVFDPYSLFDIGFQLSYIAVLAIAALYKPIYSLWIPKRKIPDYLWQIVAVSLAAQIGTSPISIYYFHQFPNYFLIANLAVIILVTPIFYLALITLVLSFIPPVASVFAFLTSWSIRLMNYIVESIQKLPFSLSEGISFDFYMLLLTIALVVGISAMLINQKKNLLYLNLGLIISMMTYSIFLNYQYEKINRFIIFDTPGRFALLYHNSDKSAIFADSASFRKRESLSFQISGYLTKYSLNPLWINLDDTSNYQGLVLKKHNYLGVEDKLFAQWNPAVRLSNQISCDYLIIRNKKTYKADKIFEQFRFKTLILSNELWPNQRDTLAASAKKQKVRIVDMAAQGAYEEEL